MALEPGLGTNPVGDDGCKRASENRRWLGPRCVFMAPGGADIPLSAFVLGVPRWPLFMM